MDGILRLVRGRLGVQEVQAFNLMNVGLQDLTLHVLAGGLRVARGVLIRTRSNERVIRPISSSRTAHPGFNPRARVGRDMQEMREEQRIICFNPRARVGRDRC